MAEELELGLKRSIRHLGHNVKSLKCQPRGTDKEVGEVRGPPGPETELGLERQIGLGHAETAREGKAGRQAGRGDGVSKGLQVGHHGGKSD